MKGCLRGVRVHQDGHAVARTLGEQTGNFQPGRTIVPRLLVHLDGSNHQQCAAWNALHASRPQAIFPQVDAALPMIASPFRVNQSAVSGLVIS